MLMFTSHRYTDITLKCSLAVWYVIVIILPLPIVSLLMKFDIACIYIFQYLFFVICVIFQVLLDMEYLYLANKNFFWIEFVSFTCILDTFAY